MAHFAQRAGRKQRIYRQGTLIVALGLAAGWATVEIQGGDEQPLVVGESRLLLVTPAEGAGPGLEVEDLDPPAADGTGTSSGDPAVTTAHHQPTAPPGVDTPLFQGRVIDAVTGAPLAGARVGWVQRWVPEGVGSVTLRHPRSTTFVQRPNTARIGDKMPQIPLFPGPLTDLRVETTSDDEGHYVLSADGQPGEFIMVLRDGYQPWFASAGGAPETELVSALDPQRLLRGRWVTESGGRPISEPIAVSAQVTYDLPDLAGWTCSVAVLTGDDHQFEARLGEVARVTVSASCPGYHDFEQEVALGPGLTTTTLTLREHPHLRGRVTDALGQPIQGVNLMVKSSTRGWLGRKEGRFSATTNDAGEYVANILGDGIEVAVQHDAYAPRDFRDVPAGVPFDIVLEPATYGSVRGIVLDDHWQPVPGAEVRVTHAGIGLVRVHRTTTDARGEFLLDELLPGQYRVSARPRIKGATEQDQGWGPEATGAVHTGVEQAGVTVESGRETTGIELVVADGATIRGTCHDADGAPRATERVSLYRPDLVGGDHALMAMVLTDAKGGFAFHGLAPGSYAVALERLETYQLVRVERGATSDVVLGGATHRLHGAVRRDGAPLADAPLNIGRITEAGIDARSSRTEPDGAYRFDGLARGRHILHVRDPADGTAFITLVEVSPDPAPLLLSWPRATVTVYFVNAVDSEAAYTLLILGIGDQSLGEAIPRSYREVAVARLTDRHTLRFSGIGPGRYQIMAQSEASTPRVVVADFLVDTTDVTLTVE